MVEWYVGWAPGGGLAGGKATGCVVVADGWLELTGFTGFVTSGCVCDLA